MKYSMDIDWLFKPVSHLVIKIQATKSRHSTQSTVDDAQAGKMIYCHGSYLSALNFVSLSMDDVELIDLVWDDKTKKIWHCADITKVNHAPESINCCLECIKWREGQIQDSSYVCEESEQTYLK